MAYLTTPVSQERSEVVIRNAVRTPDPATIQPEQPAPETPQTHALASLTG